MYSYRSATVCARSHLANLFGHVCERVRVRAFVWVLVCCLFVIHSSLAANVRARTAAVSRAYAHTCTAQSIESNGITNLTHLFDIIIGLRRRCHCAPLSLALSFCARTLFRFIALAIVDWRWFDLSRFLLVNDTTNSYTAQVTNCARDSMQTSIVNGFFPSALCPVVASASQQHHERNTLMYYK